MSATGDAREQVTTSASGTIEMCSVRAGELLVGLPINLILEIVGSVRPQLVPLAQEFIAGLVHHRGDVLTVVSLRILLGLPPLERSQPALVLEGSSGCYGVLVDSVGEVLTVSSEAYEPNPSAPGPGRNQILGGAYKLHNGLLVVLDLARLDTLHLAAAGMA